MATFLRGPIYVKYWRGPIDIATQIANLSQPLGSPLILTKGVCAFQFGAFQVAPAFQVCEQGPPQYDWPQAKRLPFFNYAPAQSMPFTLTQPVVVNPIIRLQDWPVPQQPPRVYAEVRRPDFSLLYSLKPPNNLQDWPPPTQPSRVYAQSYSSPATLTFVQTPFNLEDWPLPIRPPRVYAEVRRADIQLLHSLIPPNNLEHWPPPVQPYRVYAQSYSTPTAYFGITPAIIRQSDWPVPTLPGKVYAEAKGSFFPLLHSLKPPQPTNYDWPNPKQILWPTSARTWIQQTNLALLVQRPPIRQSDWPNPWFQQTTKVRSQEFGSPIALIGPVNTSTFFLVM